MKDYQFTIPLEEYRESLPFYSPNDMDDIVLEVEYSHWTQKGVSQIHVFKVVHQGVDVSAVLYALRAMDFIERLAQENYEMRKVEKCAKNYQHIHRNAMADAYERSEWQKIK